MVEVREGRASETDGEELNDADQWDLTIHGKQNPLPEKTHPDLWEAMKALPARQYQAITLTYWGGMTDEAVASEMGISSQAVDALLKKAKTNLAEGVGIAVARGITNIERRNGRKGLKS